MCMCDILKKKCINKVKYKNYRRRDKKIIYTLKDIILVIKYK